MRKCSIRSGKNKAVRAQNHVREAILADHPELSREDVTTARMSQAGADIILSAKAKEVHPFEYEVKAHANGFAKAYAALAQADRTVDAIAVAVVKEDRKPPLAILSYDDFRALLRLVKP